MSTSSEWCVAVFKCNPDSIKKVLVEVYRFADILKGVRSLHFLITDRIGEEIVFSFRALVEPKLKEIVEKKLALKLGTLLPADKYAVEPSAGIGLGKYIASLPERKIGQEHLAYDNFLDVLKKMSALVVDMVENDLFVADQRVDLTHFITWILGCTECGTLSLKGMQVGYYDRVEDKFRAYLKYDFPK